jgi:hypothetical protein
MNMAILNITYNGLSVDYTVAIDAAMTDQDIRRTAVELIRAGDLPGLHIAHLPENAFDNYVVDRLATARGRGAAGQRIYLRPKVPFG